MKLIILSQFRFRHLSKDVLKVGNEDEALKEFHNFVDKQLLKFGADAKFFECYCYLDDKIFYSFNHTHDIGHYIDERKATFTA